MSPDHLRRKLRKLGHDIPAEVDAAARRKARDQRREQAEAKLRVQRGQIESLAAAASLALEEVMRASPLPLRGKIGKVYFNLIMTRALMVWMLGRVDETAERRRKHQREWARRKAREARMARDTGSLRLQA